jgi:hypothetical protein
VQAIPGPHSDSVWLIAQLPLKALPAGHYHLEVTVKDLAHNDGAVGGANFDLE